MLSKNQDSYQTLYNKNFYIFTGGPGVGKTALLCEMGKRNYSCVSERAREIIIEQARMNADSPQWRKSEQFRNLTFKKSVDDYLTADSENTGVTFFDRGILDSCGDTPGEEYETARKKYRYNKKVFLFPPWKQIYVNDKERIQTYEEAVNVFKKIIKVYEKYGYELIEVPKLRVEERADFVIANLK